MIRNEYPYPEGKILTQELCEKFNNSIGYLNGNFPFAGLYVAPERAFLVVRRYPIDLAELYEELTPEQKRVTRNVYGTFLNHLQREGKVTLELGGLPEQEELYPTLEYARRFTPVGLSQVRGVGRNGRLFIYHSIRES